MYSKICQSEIEYRLYVVWFPTFHRIVFLRNVSSTSHLLPALSTLVFEAHETQKKINNMNYTAEKQQSGFWNSNGVVDSYSSNNNILEESTIIKWWTLSSGEKFYSSHRMLISTKRELLTLHLSLTLFWRNIFRTHVLGAKVHQAGQGNLPTYPLWTFSIVE